MRYGAQQARWAAAAHRTPAAETISLEISAIYEKGEKQKNPHSNIIGSICEGLKDVDVQISAQALTSLALATIIPRIKAYNNLFPWCESEFIVCDEKWVNLSTYADMQPYFYAECLHPSKAKNSHAVVFKTEQFALYVVVPEKQWVEYETFKEKGQSEASPPRTRRLRSSISTAGSSLAVHDAVPPPQARLSLAAPVPQLPLTSGSAKRTHWHSDSATSSISTRSPPPKRTPTFASPDRNELKEALKAGGAADFDIERERKHRVEPVYFHPIPSVDLNQLVRRDKVAFNICLSESFPGTIRLDFASDAMLGVGAFKTAQTAQLTLVPLHPSGLGSQGNDKVVIKRTYIPTGTEAADFILGIRNSKYMRPSLGEQAQKLYREANALYWSKALLKMMYDYIDHCVNTAAKPPPFELPRLRFVDAGLVLAYAERPTSSGPFSGRSNAGTLSSVYLAEEVIPSIGEEGTDGFIKFIHNANAAPRELDDPAANEIAEFLSFTQHVQYTKTGGLAFLSDYQGQFPISRLIRYIMTNCTLLMAGCPPLLTDPQVLTHPYVINIGCCWSLMLMPLSRSVSDGEVLFSGGNVEEMVTLFESQHICNRFCLWPGFRLETVGGGTESDGESDV
ncbi:hypothetical protein JVT61DRAFT_7177 [Boletus reticuloceps]|uniref:Alpha-type protein kinase domain-containing protein n=1 Tax=Boletus reticuloceps TaxID=495285 RepID=A0A8I2YK88_9AGAM|nr:hypothetical protein JVT61DRAFT_7177 [Boletus reticuloceps]